MAYRLSKYCGSRNWHAAISGLYLPCIYRLYNQKPHEMVRYIMSYSVPEGRLSLAQQIINSYFEMLYRQGPGGMRSQCYATDEDECRFVHIKSFKKESVAHHHFRSAAFREYIQKIAAISGSAPTFSRLMQQQTFESIY